MKKQIRKNVFETNSSSTHSICIAKDLDLTFPEKVHFQFGEFGWEIDSLNSISEKASYLYTALAYNDRLFDFGFVIATLKSKNVEMTCEDSKTSDTGYIDHGGNLDSFLNAVIADEKKLLSYLFSPLSFILTGNDNDEHEVDIDVTYPHDEYYKGN